MMHAFRVVAIGRETLYLMNYSANRLILKLITESTIPASPHRGELMSEHQT